MIIEFSHSRELIFAGDRAIPATCKVRNELNGQRPRKGEPDVCRTILRSGKSGPPVMPRQFPIGTWKVNGFVRHDDVYPNGSPVEPYLFPWFIGTDANEELDEWELDEHGFYAGKTGRKVESWAYGFHYSSSLTTLGCIRISSEADLRWLRDNIEIGDTVKVTG
jgi:hypothetical protein